MELQIKIQHFGINLNGGKTMSMTKTEIRNDIMRQFPKQGFLSLREINDYLGTGEKHASKVMKGVYYLPYGHKGKKYHIDDIAEKLSHERVFQK